MTTTYTLFLRWMAAKGLSSGREAAKALHVSPMGPTNWKNGHNAAAHIVERMATDLGEDPATHLIQVFLETAKGKDVATIKRLAKRISTSALLSIAMLAPLLPELAAASGDIHYAKSRPNRRKRKPVTEPEIALPLYDPGAASFPARFPEYRNGTAALPETRSTDERLRSRPVRTGSQRRGRSVRRVGRLAA